MAGGIPAVPVAAKALTFQDHLGGIVVALACRGKAAEAARVVWYQFPIGSHLQRAGEVARRGWHIIPTTLYVG